MPFCTRLLPLLFVAVACASTVHAQHCAFDNSAAVVVEPRDATTGRVVSGLRITLVDSLGQPITRYKDGHLFRDRTTGVMANEQDAWHQSVYHRLWFAQGAYVLVTGYHPREHFQVRVEDVDRRSDGVFYDPVTMPLADDAFHSLCLGNGDWDEGEGSTFARTFHPVSITLVRRDVQ